jgi:hypothetical protein
LMTRRPQFGTNEGCRPTIQISANTKETRLEGRSYAD